MEEMRSEFSLPEDYAFSPPGPVASDGHPMFFGTAAQISDDLASLRSAGVDHLLLRFSVGFGEIDPDGFIEQMRRFASEIVPRFT